MIGRLRAAGTGWVEDQASQMGAALAYYTLFSLTPLLIIAMGVLASVLGEAGSREHVVKQVHEFVDPETANAVRVMLDGFRTTHAQATTSIVGFLSLCFGATGMFTSLRTSLNRIFRVTGAKDGMVTGVVKTYLLAILMVFVTCTFLVILLLVSTAMPLLAKIWAEQIPDVPWSGPVVDLAVSTLLLTLLFVFTYRFMSDGQIGYRYLWGGAFVSAILFGVGKMGIGFYLSYVNLASAYGAAGSVVVFLAWVYYSAQIIFFGAEVIRFGLPGNAPCPTP